MIALSLTSYLCEQGSQDDRAEDWVFEDALEDVPLSVNLAGVELVEDLHEDKGVEHYGVVLRGRGMEGGVPAAVNVEQILACEREGQRLLKARRTVNPIPPFFTS